MKDLIFCVMQRHGRAATAGEITDMALAMAQAEGWPRRSWSSLTAASTAATLRGMESRGEVSRAGFTLERGHERPTWAPLSESATSPSQRAPSYDPRSPVPDRPDPTGDDHPLHGKGLRAQFALFDALDTAVAAYGRMHTEAVDMHTRHCRELADMSAKIKRDLFAAGLGEAP